MARLDPRRRRILLTKRRGTRLFRTIQLYDRRPAIRGGGHDPRAADAAAVKTRLVVVAVVLLQHLARYHIGREDAGCIYQTGPRAKALPAAREHREAAPRVAGALGARSEGHILFCATVLFFLLRAAFLLHAAPRARLGCGGWRLRQGKLRARRGAAEMLAARPLVQRNSAKRDRRGPRA